MQIERITFREYEIIVTKVREAFTLNERDAQGWIARNVGIHLIRRSTGHCGLVTYERGNPLIMERIQKILGPYGNTFIRMIHVTQEDCE